MDKSKVKLPTLEEQPEQKQRITSNVTLATLKEQPEQKHQP